MLGFRIVLLLNFGVFTLVSRLNTVWVSWFTHLPVHFYNIYFYLTTTSGRPEPECTLRRVMSSEPIQDEQLTRDGKQTTNN